MTKKTRSGENCPSSLSAAGRAVRDANPRGRQPGLLQNSLDGIRWTGSGQTTLTGCPLSFPLNTVSIGNKLGQRNFPLQ